MRSKVLALSAAALIVLGGCSSNGDSSEETTSPTQSTADSGGKQVQEGSGEQAVFGGSFVYDSGLEITVGDPTPFTPTANAAGGQGAASFVQFEVTVVNNSRRDFDMGEFLVALSSDGELADPVFDSESGLSTYPEEPVVKGGNVTFLVGYGVADPSAMEMSVSPNPDLETAVFRTP